MSECQLIERETQGWLNEHRENQVQFCRRYLFGALSRMVKERSAIEPRSWQSTSSCGYRAVGVGVCKVGSTFQRLCTSFTRARTVLLHPEKA